MQKNAGSLATIETNRIGSERVNCQGFNSWCFRIKFYPWNEVGTSFTKEVTRYRLTSCPWVAENHLTDERQWELDIGYNLMRLI